MRRRFTLFFLLFCPLAQAQSPHKTTHVIFVMTDGFRWQDSPRAPEDLMNQEKWRS